MVINAMMIRFRVKDGDIIYPDNVDMLFETIRGDSRCIGKTAISHRQREDPLRRNVNYKTVRLMRISRER